MIEMDAPDFERIPRQTAVLIIGVMIGLWIARYIIKPTLIVVTPHPKHWPKGTK